MIDIVLIFHAVEVFSVEISNPLPLEVYSFQDNTVKQKISFSYCRNYLITVKGEINPKYNVIFIFIGASILWNSFILKSTKMHYSTSHHLFRFACERHRF